MNVIESSISREFVNAIRKGVATDDIRVARALIEVHAVEINPRNVYAGVQVAIGAAARLNLQPSQIRRLYGNGHATYDLVNEAVAAAS